MLVREESTKAFQVKKVHMDSSEHITVYILHVRAPPPLGMRIKPSSTKESNENCGIYLEK
jgi:hypothetical protein